jgi:hypothetical protein
MPYRMGFHGIDGDAPGAVHIDGVFVPSICHYISMSRVQVEAPFAAVIVKLPESVVPVSPVPRIVQVYEPETEGVPLIIPVEVFKFTPAGKAPVCTA